MKVEVLTGLPGCGKSYDFRQEAIQNPGLYLFAYPSRELVAEQLAAFENEASPEVRVVEAHSSAPGSGTVQNRLERHQAYFRRENIDHAVILMTHEGLMGSDLTAFGDWHVRIDEAPNTIQSGKVRVPASASLLEQMIEIVPIGAAGWGELRLRGPKQSWPALANDDLLKPLAEMLKQASRSHGVFVDTLVLKGSFGWCSIWPLKSVEHCKSVKIAGASYLISLGAIVAERWEQITFDPKAKPTPRLQSPTVRIHYFTQSHEGDTSFWRKPRGIKFIANIARFLASEEPALGYWSANDVVVPLLTGHISGNPISAKAAGLNEYDEETSCAFIYSSKPQSGDEVAQAVFGITNDEILRAREEEDILQFVTRGAIRKRDFGGQYDIYLYSRRQAELVKQKLAAYGLSGSIVLIPEPGAGIMDVLKDPLKPLRDTLIAGKKAASQQKAKDTDADRKKKDRADQAIAEGREPSANGGLGGRPKGSKDKAPRKARTKRS